MTLNSVHYTIPNGPWEQVSDRVRQIIQSISSLDIPKLETSVASPLVKDTDYDSDTYGQITITVGDGLVDNSGTLEVDLATNPGLEFDGGDLTVKVVPPGGIAVGDNLISNSSCTWVNTGGELVDNGGFDADTDWSKGTGWTIPTPTANCDGSQVSISALFQGFALSATQYKNYRAIATITRAAGRWRLRQGSGGSNWFSDFFAAGASPFTTALIGTGTSRTFVIDGDADFIGTADDVSVFERTLPDWTRSTNTANSQVTEVDPNEGHGGAGATGGAVNLFTDDGTVTYIRQNNVVTVGKSYRLTLDITDAADGAIKVIDGLGNLILAVADTAQTYTVDFVAVDPDVRIWRQSPVQSCDITINNIRIYETSNGGILIDDAGLYVDDTVYVPYVNATDNVDLGDNTLTTLNSGTFGWVNITDETAGLQFDGSTILRHKDTNNLGLGKGVLGSLTSGGYNVVVGDSAFDDATSAAFCVAVGASAGKTATEGIGNTLIGSNAGQELGTGGSNTFIGHGSGPGSPAAMASGSGNVAIGASAGQGLQSGDGNVLIGNAAGQSLTTQSNQLHIDNSATATPLIQGDFDTNSLIINGTLKVTSACDFDSTVNIAGVTTLDGTESILAGNTGTLTLGGVSNANNENLTLDFETVVNEVTVDSTTGVTDINFDMYVQSESAAGAGFVASSTTSYTNAMFFGCIDPSCSIVFDNGGTLRFIAQTTANILTKTLAGGTVALIVEADGDIVVTKDVACVNLNASSNVGCVTLNASRDVIASRDVVGPKSKITSIGGYAIKLTNKTGDRSVAGQIVEISGTTDNAFEIAALDSLAAIGVALDAGPSDSGVFIVVSGIAEVLADRNDFVRGDRLITSGADAGSAEASNAPAVAVHFQEIGHALEGATSGNTGKVVLHFN